MRLDLLELLRQDTAAQAEIQSYGIDPTKVEEWLTERAPAYNDPTATTAINNVMREARTRR